MTTWFGVDTYRASVASYMEFLEMADITADERAMIEYSNAVRVLTARPIVVPTVSEPSVSNVTSPFWWKFGSLFPVSAVPRSPELRDGAVFGLPGARAGHRRPSPVGSGGDVSTGG